MSVSSWNAEDFFWPPGPALPPSPPPRFSPPPTPVSFCSCPGVSVPTHKKRNTWLTKIQWVLLSHYERGGIRAGTTATTKYPLLGTQTVTTQTARLVSERRRAPTTLPYPTSYYRRRRVTKASAACRRQTCQVPRHPKKSYFVGTVRVLNRKINAHQKGALQRSLHLLLLFLPGVYGVLGFAFPGNVLQPPVHHPLQIVPAYGAQQQRTTSPLLTQMLRSAKK